MVKRDSDSASPPEAPAESNGFLPDFCGNRAVFLLVLIAELLALLLALARAHSMTAFWTELALASLATQWVALITALSLCRSSRWLQRQSSTVITAYTVGLVQLSTLVCGWLAMALTAHAELTPDAAGAWSARVNDQAISGIVTLLALRYFYIQHQWKQQMQAEALARWQALQARIHPHFLFNTLNTIASLIPDRPQAAEQAVLDLADLLRSTLSQRAFLALGEELELTRRYLAIESLRLGARLQVDWRLAADLPLQLNLPALLLQPLVENAIYHGLQRLPEGGTLTITIERQGHALCFTVANPRPDPDHGPRRAGQGLAQDNIRQRLRLAYDTLEPLRIVATPNHYRVSFRIPLT